MKNRFVFLDRDGVINRDSADYIKSPEEWQPLPGSLEAIAALCQAGEQIAIITNQSGVNRQLFDLNTLQKIHQKMLNAIEAHGGKIEKIYFCPHHPDENCTCRKPGTGMLEQCQDDFDPDFSKSYLIGDSLKDLQAGLAMGCRIILVKTGNGQKTLSSQAPELERAVIVDDLAAAVRYILE
jgi:D-glycero-D-manno-heptose 1,7-bisphosphate phosphatase